MRKTFRIFHGARVFFPSPFEVSNASVYFSEALNDLSDASVYFSDASNDLSDALVYFSDASIDLSDASVYFSDALNDLSDALVGTRVLSAEGEGFLAIFAAFQWIFFMRDKNKLQIRNSTAEFLIFTEQVNAEGIEVRVQDGTIWLSQKRIAQLFDCSTDNVSLHLKNIFIENELDEISVAEDFSVTASDGKNYHTKHYNLDAIIAVGYRVNSKRATAFRQWATSVLRDFALRGYIIDRKRMENGTFLSEDYFEHLLAEIREIRLSERRFYQKITDIYATAMDYNKNALETRKFFAKVQNKLHYAIHGRTAAELIVARANAEKEHMGLTSWENSPSGKVVKTDVVVAKNYLEEEELASLGRLVNAYLDLAEDRAKRHIPMTMEDWAKRLDAFLSADDRRVLQDNGAITAKAAKDFAEGEFEKYRITQDQLFESDFDREMQRIENK